MDWDWKEKYLPNRDWKKTSKRTSRSPRGLKIATLHLQAQHTAEMNTRKIVFVNIKEDKMAQ